MKPGGKFVYRRLPHPPSVGSVDINKITEIFRNKYGKRDVLLSIITHNSHQVEVKRQKNRQKPSILPIVVINVNIFV